MNTVGKSVLMTEQQQPGSDLEEDRAMGLETLLTSLQQGLLTKVLANFTPHPLRPPMPAYLVLNHEQKIKSLQR